MTPPLTARPVTYGLDASIATFSVARYQRMIEAGILTPEDKVELLENYVVLKMPRNPLHDSTIQRMLEPLFLRRPPGWSWRIQSAVTLADSEPEPDLALVRGSAADYETHHPGPPDIGLVIEVAHSSLLRDRRDKARLYARAGIVCYWIANLVDRQIEVHTEPSGPTADPAYAAVQTYRVGDHLHLTLGGQTVGTLAVADLLA